MEKRYKSSLDSLISLFIQLHLAPPLFSHSTALHFIPHRRNESTNRRGTTLHSRSHPSPLCRLLTRFLQNPSFVLQSVKSVAFEDRPIPEIKNSNDVLIKIEITGICGSDVPSPSCWVCVS